VVLSKRERYVAIAAIIVVTLLVADRYIVSWFLDRRAKVEAERQSLLGEMERATSLFKRRKLMDQKWQEMVSGGLESDASKAESQVLHAVRNWSQECGLVLSSVKPEHTVGQGNLQEIMFMVAGTGTMSSVGQFLWRIETASLPLKIKEIQLGSRKEDADDLSLQLRLSALYLPAEAQAPTAEKTRGSAGETVE
jgi:Tfp pilus assembly protein PilO